MAPDGGPKVRFHTSILGTAVRLSECRALRIRVQETDSSPVADVPQSLPAPADHPEFFPLTTFAGLVHGPARLSVVPSLKLETTGITEQKNQSELFSRQLIYKNSVAAKLHEIGCLDLAGILDECHTRKAFAECCGCRKVRVFWNRCENFFCPACQPRLARDRFESLEWWTHQVSQPKHVVLTVRNTDKFSFQYVRWFKDCWKKLRRSKFARNWRGGLWSLEVTNEDRGWHLHLHALIDCRFIPEGELAIRWGKLVGQDYAIVKVKDARRKDYLKEVTKYAVKGSELSRWTPKQIAEFVYAFQGQRTFGVFGELYGKRTEWREWIEANCGQKQTCDCGCNKWRIFDDLSWEAHLLEQEMRSGKSMPPPAKCTRSAELTLFKVHHLQDGLITVS